MPNDIEDGLIVYVDPSNYQEALGSPTEVVILKAFAVDHIQANCIVFLTNKRLKVFRLQNFFQHFSLQMPRMLVGQLFGTLVAIGYEAVSGSVEVRRVVEARRRQHRWIEPLDLATCASKKMETLSIQFDDSVSRFKRLEIKNANGGAQLQWQWAGSQWAIKGVPKSNLIHAFSPRAFEALKAIAQSASHTATSGTEMEISDARIVITPTAHQAPKTASV